MNGNCSYEIDLYKGGKALILGNLIQQSLTTRNSIIIKYAEEGLFWPTNYITVVQNTIVNDLTKGYFLKVAAGNVSEFSNNILVGVGGYVSTFQTTLNVQGVKNSDFANGTYFYYQILKTSKLIGKTVQSNFKPAFPLVGLLLCLHPHVCPTH